MLYNGEKFANGLGIYSYPASIILDKNGKVDIFDYNTLPSLPHNPYPNCPNKTFSDNPESCYYWW